MRTWDLLGLHPDTIDWLDDRLEIRREDEPDAEPTDALAEEFLWELHDNEECPRATRNNIRCWMIRKGVLSYIADDEWDAMVVMGGKAAKKRMTYVVFGKKYLFERHLEEDQ